MTTLARLPIIRLGGKLVLMIQSDLDDSVADWIRQEVSAKLAQTSASGLIIDLSGVELLDSFVTRCLHELAQIARLMGVATVLAGLRPAVVLTLVEMGMEVRGVSTALNLDHALELLDARESAEAAEAANEIDQAVLESEPT